MMRARRTRTALAVVSGLALYAGAAHAELPISQVPLFLTQGATPIAMLNMSNDHQLYFEAYPDYADLTGDGQVNSTYDHDIDYYGYFDSYKCYEYSGGQFNPSRLTDDKYCIGSEWSGNFLNWISMARIDAVRKILYGGHRYIDEADETVLERTYLPNDGHSWQRFYDGDDLPQLSPFNVPQATTGSSDTDNDLSAGTKEFATTFRDDEVDTGDQLILRGSAEPSERFLVGVVTAWDGSTGALTIEVSEDGWSGTGSPGSWDIENLSRRGVTFCNTTATDTQFSQDVTDPPLIRVAAGNYSLWTANERWQCQWAEEEYRTGHPSMEIGDVAFSNGNDAAFTGIFANSDNPWRATYGLGQQDYNVRVSVCEEDLLGEEDCKRYPDGNFKPIGLLQEFGDAGAIDFGLMTGSYARNRSGGVLRRNVASMADEINVDTDGTFRDAPDDGSIIDTLERFRIFGYDHGPGYYNTGGSGGDDCEWGQVDPTEGTCTNWGNPQSEMFLETLRYLSGANGPNFGLDGGNDRISGLGEADWEDPLGDANYCAPTNIISFNASSTTDDSDFDGISDIPGAPGSAAALTNVVGEGEGIHGNEWFVGQAGGDNDQLCTPKVVNALGDVEGICPEAPRQQGSYDIAGLAHHAWTNDMRPDLPQFDQRFETYGVSLAPAVPRVEIPLPGTSDPAVSLLPACRNANGSNCAIVDFRIVDQNVDEGTGAFFIQWEDSEQGGDYDMDMNGVLSYEITGTQIVVTTNVFAESTSQTMGFGYVVSGTDDDGFHVHSGVNDFRMDGCNVSGCEDDDPATSKTFSLGGGTADLLEQPLYYAAKWGGFDRDAVDNDGLVFPDDAETWQDPETGLPRNYYFSADPRQLAEDLRDVFSAVASDIGSAAAVAANTTRVDTETLIYQALFNSEDWTGDLLAYPVDEETGEVDEANPEWSAAQGIPQPSQRRVLSWDRDNETGVRLQSHTDLPDHQFDALAASDLGSVEDLFDYLLLGDQSREQRTGNGDFRNRVATVLGDIVNSSPFVTRGRNMAYNVLDDDEGGDSYRQFLSNKRERDPILYVGANDGMLHAFDARASGGNEIFTFASSVVFDELPQLADQNYRHRYFVDGQIEVADAHLGAGWQKVLLGSTGAGPAGVFALNVTDVTTSSTSATDNIVMWEIDQTHDEVGDQLGHVLEDLHIFKTNDGEWVALFGNGYNSAEQNAHLVIVPLEDPDDAFTIETQNTPGDNGLGGVTPVDMTGNGLVDWVYGGDLEGNMWRFDLSSDDSSDWTANLLFQAVDEAGDPQPITAAPAVVPHTSADVEMSVLFGTGRFFLDGDEEAGDDAQIQTFYSLQDDGETTIAGRNELHEVRITSQENVDDDVASAVRRIGSDGQIEASDRGWYLDLAPNGVRTGERVIDKPLIIGDRVFFLSQIPEPDICAQGGRSWLNEVGVETGERSRMGTFDDIADDVAGISFEEGLATGLPALRSGDFLRLYPSLSSGGTAGPIDVFDPRGEGRQSWKEHLR